MAITQSRPPKTERININQEEYPLAETQDFLEGLYTDDDPLKLPLNALVQADNIAYFRKMLFRRNGTLVYPIAAPNAEQIQNIWAFNDLTSGLNILRVTPAHIHKFQSNGFVNFPPSGIAAMAGNSLNYFSFTDINNRAFFTNGVDPIREIDAVLQVYKALGNAPSYQFITGAFNRVIGANLTAITNIPTQIGWSGDANYGEYNPLVDISAGSATLFTSPASISDDITGLFSVAQLLVIPRQRSIWLATHSASATAPFNFFAQIPRIGADLPRTILLTDYGIIWVNQEKGLVYVWDPITEVKPNDITFKIQRQLKLALNNASQVWATYSFEAQTYEVFVSYAGTQTVSKFIWNFRTKTWNTESIGGGITCCADLDYANSSLTINQLSGTILQLLGSIFSLGGIVANDSRFYGSSTGVIETQTFYSGLASELANIATTDNGRVFTTSIQSKTIEVPIYDTHINLVRAAVTPYSTGTVTLQWSKDEGNTWRTAKSITFVAGDLTLNKLIQLNKSIKARRFTWRVTSTDCMFALNGFYIRAVRAGVDSK